MQQCFIVPTAACLLSCVPASPSLLLLLLQIDVMHCINSMDSVTQGVHYGAQCERASVHVLLINVLLIHPDKSCPGLLVLPPL